MSDNELIELLKLAAEKNGTPLYPYQIAFARMALTHTLEPDPYPHRYLGIWTPKKS